MTEEVTDTRAVPGLLVQQMSVSRVRYRLGRTPVQANKDVERESGADHPVDEVNEPVHSEADKGLRGGPGSVTAGLPLGDGPTARTCCYREHVPRARGCRGQPRRESTGPDGGA